MAYDALSALVSIRLCYIVLISLHPRIVHPPLGIEVWCFPTRRTYAPWLLAIDSRAAMGTGPIWRQNIEVWNNTSSLSVFCFSWAGALAARGLSARAASIIICEIIALVYMMWTCKLNRCIPLHFECSSNFSWHFKFSKLSEQCLSDLKRCSCCPPRVRIRTQLEKVHGRFTRCGKSKPKTCSS